MEANVLKLIDRPREDTDFLDRFLRGRPDTTRRVYKGEVGMFQAFINKPLRLAGADDLRSYVERCRVANLRPATMRGKIATIKSLFSFLYEEGLINADPMKRVPTPPHPQTDGSRCLTAKQVKAFFSVMPTHRTIGIRDRAMFLLAACCGLRLSELSRLSVRDISEGSEKDWMFATVHGKGDKQRVIQIRPEVWVEIQQYLRRRKDELSGAAPLFRSLRRGFAIRPQKLDLRIPPATIYKRYKSYSHKAELPERSAPHWLRHYFASEAHKKGAPAEAIRKALGHTSLATTQRYLDGLDTGLNLAFVAVQAV